MAENTATTEPGRVRLSSLGLAFVVASALLSVVSYRFLPDVVRVRWTVGVHYGPEYAPTGAVLVAFPLVVAGLYVGARWLGDYLGRAVTVDDSGEFRTVYDACVLLTLGLVVAGQFVVVALNWWY